MSIATVNSLDSAISSSQSSGAIATNGNTAGTSANNSLGLRNEFLQMMVAQVQNQDPTNPLDGTQYVSQLAQFSMVEGVENLKVLQQKSISMMDTGQVLQSTSLVGKEVVVPADSLKLDADKVVKGRIELPGAADKVALKVYNEYGQQVKAVEWGGQSGGMLDYDLGSLPAGKYTFSVTASGESLSSQPKNYLASTVERVKLPGDGQIMLQVSGLGDVSLYNTIEFGNAA